MKISKGGLELKYFKKFTKFMKLSNVKISSHISSYIIWPPFGKLTYGPIILSFTELENVLEDCSLPGL